MREVNLYKKQKLSPKNNGVQKECDSVQKLIKRKSYQKFNKTYPKTYPRSLFLIRIKKTYNYYES